MRICPECHKQLPDFVAFCPNDGAKLIPVDEPQDLPKEEKISLDNKELGSYRLEEVIAEGGMGVVFLARHTRLGRKVALKKLRPEYTGNKKAITRFFREARAVNEIRHDNIIEITDFIENADGENYYIMELLEGRSLKELLAETDRLPVPRVIPIAIQVANALAAVHEAGIIHRDLKPDNVYLIQRGDNPDYVKLLDFGIAKLIRFAEEEENAHKTIEGTILGTAEYMSPEQASGKPVDHRTDVYALGVILYEMLTGEKPIPGENFREIIYNQIAAAVIPPSRLESFHGTLPAHLEQLIMQCLEKNPDKRPQGMEEVESRLAQIGRAGSVQVETDPSFRPPALRRRKVAYLLAGLIIAVAIGVGASLVLDSEEARSEVPGDEQLVHETPGPGRDAGTKVSTAHPAGEVDTVEIHFQTKPPGAEVLRDGEVLGHTPMQLPFPREERQCLFSFRLKNHALALRRISLASDGSVLVNMKKKGPMKKKRKRKTTSRGPRDVELGRTVDPFEE